MRHKLLCVAPFALPFDKANRGAADKSPSWNKGLALVDEPVWALFEPWTSLSRSSRDEDHRVVLTWLRLIYAHWGNFMAA